jgi:hypothetical protein
LLFVVGEVALPKLTSVAETGENSLGEAGGQADHFAHEARRIRTGSEIQKLPDWELDGIEISASPFGLGDQLRDIPVGETERSGGGWHLGDGVNGFPEWSLVVL